MNPISLDAPILPGRGAAGLSLGTRISDLLAAHHADSAERLGDGISRYRFGPVRVWAKLDLIDQIGVCHGYRGALHESIRLGSSIGEVEQLVGKVVEDEEDCLITPTLAGWCFETERWSGDESVETNRDKLITEIFVFRTDRVAPRASGTR